MNYNHLTIEERACISKFKEMNLSIREMAKLIDRSPSINYLVTRYSPIVANKKYKNRRIKCHRKVELNIEIKTYIESKIEINWSPDQICNYENEKPQNIPSVSTIYRWISKGYIIKGDKTKLRRKGNFKRPAETFQIKLWMHSEVTALDKDSMNSEYNGKIKIITGYLEPLLELADTIKKIPVVTSGNGLYEVSHSDANITYTSDSTAINNLKQTEYRFAGNNPNNYVNFNNEVWRVIGLVNTPEGQRIKLVRNESIGSYS